MTLTTTDFVFSDKSDVAPAASTAKGLWNADVQSLTVFMSRGGMVADKDYTFSFTVRNPAGGQKSPVVQVESSGIAIARVRMDKNPELIRLTQVYESVRTEEAEPLEVRGETEMNAFKVKSIGQKDPNPGATNTIWSDFPPLRVYGRITVQWV